MAEIIEKVGFETGQAVAALNKLDAALKGVNRRLTRFNKVAGESSGQAAAKAMDDVARSAEKAKKSVTATGKAMQQTGKQGAAAAQKITIGFSGLAKALVAREAVQALNRLKNAILESAEAAAEFEIAIARISNIAQGPGSSIDSLTRNLADLAVELGRPQTEVATAAFEALQNDLGTTAETMKLLQGAANDLALVTGGTLTQSINSLSSVLKAYDLDISEASRISDIFFAAIDKGRINLEELESSLGKITPLAAQLEIDFENVAAAMAAITQQGTSASVANTQLRSIMQKLIRPTEELQGAFNKLGVDTFQELIARSGNLQVALQDIAGALNNDERAIATAFGRLRGQLGVFNLLANEGKIFKDTLDAVADSAGKAAEGAATIDATAARESQKAWAQFAETMRVVGETVLEVQTSFIQSINAIIPKGRDLEDTIDGIADAALALGTGAVVAALLAFGGALAVPIGIATGVATAILAIKNSVDLVFGSAADNLDNIGKDLADEVKEIEDKTVKAMEQTNAEVKALLDQRGEAADEYVRGLKDSFERETAAIKDAAERASIILNNSFEDFTKGLDDIFDNIESKAKAALKQLDKAKKKSADAQQEIDDFKFDRDGEKLSDTQKFNRELERLEETGGKLEDALKDASIDPQAAAEAERLAGILQDQAQAARDRAEEDGNAFRKREGIAKANEQELKALEAKKTLAQQEEKILESRANQSSAEVKEQAAIKDQIKQQLDILKEQRDFRDEKGQIKTPEQDLADDKAVAETEGKLQKLFDELDIPLLEKFGEADNLRALEEAFNEGVARAEVDFGSVREQLQAKFNEAAFRVQIEASLQRTGNKAFDERLAGAAESGGINPAARAEAVRKEQAAIVQEQVNAQKQLDGEIKELGKRQAASAEAYATAIRAKSVGDLFAADEINAVRTKLEELFTKLKSESLTPEGAEAVDTQLDALSEKITGLVDKETISTNLAAGLQEAVAQAKEAVGTAEDIIPLRAQFDQASLDTLITQLAGVKVEPLPFLGVETATKNTAENVANTATGIGNMKTAAEQALPAFNSLAAAAERAATAARNAAAAKASAGLYHGGAADYLAAGGRGGDNIPAFLKKGEFVMNSRSTRQFYSQIQAMNAGQTPQFRENGGSVTTIGDINVNVTGGAGSENPDVAGRQIANSLRRELRRNTSAL